MNLKEFSKKEISNKIMELDETLHSANLVLGEVVTQYDVMINKRRVKPKELGKLITMKKNIRDLIKISHEYKNVLKDNLKEIGEVQEKEEDEIHKENIIEEYRKRIRNKVKSNYLINPDHIEKGIEIAEKNFPMYKLQAVKDFKDYGNKNNINIDLKLSKTFMDVCWDAMSFLYLLNNELKINKYG